MSPVSSTTWGRTVTQWGSFPWRTYPPQWWRVKGTNPNKTRARSCPMEAAAVEIRQKVREMDQERRSMQHEDDANKLAASLAAGKPVGLGWRCRRGARAMVREFEKRETHRGRGLSPNSTNSRAALADNYKRARFSRTWCVCQTIAPDVTPLGALRVGILSKRDGRCRK